MSQVITLDEFKAFLQIGAPEIDGIAQSCVDAAEYSVETWCGIAMRVPPIVRVEFRDAGDRAIFLDRKPIVAVTEIYDLSTSTAIDPSNYVAYGSRGEIKGQGNYPIGCGGAWQSLRVTYTTGYAAVANVPEDIKQLILRLARLYYERRDQWTSQSYAGITHGLGNSMLPIDVTNLLARYRRFQI